MPEKLYRNKETGEVIKWTGSGKPTSDQLKSISLKRKADLEQKKMEIRSDVQKQTPPAFNISELPQDIYQTGKQYLENLGSAVTFPFEGLYALGHGPYSPEFQKFAAPIVQRPESAVPIVGPSLSLARTGFTPEGVRSALTGAAAGITAIAPFVPDIPLWGAKPELFKSPTEVISRTGATVRVGRPLQIPEFSYEDAQIVPPEAPIPQVPMAERTLPAKIEPPKVPPIIPPEVQQPTPSAQLGTAPTEITSRPEPGVIQPPPVIRLRRVTGPVSGPGEVPFRPTIGEPQSITFPATRPLALEASPIEPYLEVPELREMLSQREIPKGGRKLPAIFERPQVSLPEEIKKPVVPEMTPRSAEPEESIVSGKAPEVSLEQLEPGPKERTIEGVKVKVIPPVESEVPPELRFGAKEPKVTLPKEEIPSEVEETKLARRKQLEQIVSARKQRRTVNPEKIVDLKRAINEKLSAAIHYDQTNQPDLAQILRDDAQKLRQELFTSEPKTQSQIDLEEIEKVVGKGKKKVPTLDELVKGEEGSLNLPNIFKWAKTKQIVKQKNFRGEALTQSERTLLKSISEDERELDPTKALLTSGNQNLASRVETSQIARIGELSQDAKAMFIQGFLHHMDRALRIPYKDRIQSFILMHLENPGEALGQNDPTGRPYSAEAIRSAVQQREATRKVIQMAKDVGLRVDIPVGDLLGYITHMDKLSGGNSELARSAWETIDDMLVNPLYDIKDHFFGRKKQDISPIESYRKPDIIYAKGVKKPTSVYIKHRSGKIVELEPDPRRLWPVYIRNMGKFIFDRPAVESMQEVIRTLTSPVDKEITTRYARDIAGYVENPLLTRSWSRIVRMLTRIAARAVLGGSLELQTLHLARSPGNIYPALETKYYVLGWMDFLSNPLGAIRTARKLGLTEITPFRMQRPMQKFDMLLNYMNVGNNLARQAGVGGFIRRAFNHSGELDASTPAGNYMNMLKRFGFNEKVLNAVGELKNADQAIDAARYIPAFHPTSEIGAIAQFFTQYKYIPYKMAEQYSRIIWNWKTNPASLWRAALGIYALYYIKKKYGLRVLHLAPETLYMFSAPIERQLFKVLTSAKKAIGNQIAGESEEADWKKVVDNLALFLLPGAQQVRLRFPITETQREERKEELKEEAQ